MTRVLYVASHGGVYGASNDMMFEGVLRVGSRSLVER